MKIYVYNNIPVLSGAIFHNHILRTILS